MVVDKFKGIKYSDLTDEQLDSLSKTELLNKFISDDVNTVNEYVMKRMISNLIVHLTIVSTILGLYIFGLVSLFLIVAIITSIYVDLFYKKSLKWSVITLKTNIALFRGNGDFCTQNDYIFEDNLSRLYNIDIGEFYDINKK